MGRKCMSERRLKNSTKITTLTWESRNSSRPSQQDLLQTRARFARKFKQIHWFRQHAALKISVLVGKKYECFCLHAWLFAWLIGVEADMIQICPPSTINAFLPTELHFLLFDVPALQRLLYHRLGVFHEISLRCICCIVASYRLDEIWLCGFQSTNTVCLIKLNSLKTLFSQKTSPCGKKTHPYTSRQHPASTM